jgi:hypothetical protein
MDELQLQEKVGAELIVIKLRILFDVHDTNLVPCTDTFGTVVNREGLKNFVAEERSRKIINTIHMNLFVKVQTNRRVQPLSRVLTILLCKHTLPNVVAMGFNMSLVNVVVLREQIPVVSTSHWF